MWCDETPVTLFCENCCDVNDHDVNVWGYDQINFVDKHHWQTSLTTISHVNIIDKHHVMIMMSLLWEINKINLQNFTKFYEILRHSTSSYFCPLCSLLNSVFNALWFFFAWCKTHWYYPYFKGNWWLQFSGCVMNWWWALVSCKRTHKGVLSLNHDMPSSTHKMGVQVYLWCKHPVDHCSKILHINPKP